MIFLKRLQTLYPRQNSCHKCLLTSVGWHLATLEPCVSKCSGHDTCSMYCLLADAQKLWVLLLMLHPPQVPMSAPPPVPAQAEIEKADRAGSVSLPKQSSLPSKSILSTKSAAPLVPSTSLPDTDAEAVGPEVSAGRSQSLPPSASQQVCFQLQILASGLMASFLPSRASEQSVKYIFLHPHLVPSANPSSCSKNDCPSISRI